jgi:hypothetical protein
VVHEPVDHGCCDDVVAEDFAPASKRFVAGDDEAGSLVTRRHELEEQVGGFGLKWDVTDLIDDYQRNAAEFDELGLKVSGVMGLS